MFWGKLPLAALILLLAIAVARPIRGLYLGAGEGTNFAGSCNRRSPTRTSPPIQGFGETHLLVPTGPGVRTVAWKSSFGDVVCQAAPAGATPTYLN
jgi:hypothetical protein